MWRLVCWWVWTNVSDKPCCIHVQGSRFQRIWPNLPWVSTVGTDLFIKTRLCIRKGFSPYDKFCARDGNAYLPYVILLRKVILVPFEVGRDHTHIQI